MNRPLVWSSIYIIIGIIGGTMWINNLHGPLFVLLAGFVSLGGYLIWKYRWNSMVVIMAIGYIAAVQVIIQPVLLEKGLFIENNEIEAIGTIVQIKPGEYNTQILLEDIVLKVEEQTKAIKSKVILQIDKKSQGYKVGDKVFANGKVMKEPLQMNPSDMDYAEYLRGKGIVARVKGEIIKVLDHKESWREKSYQQITERINQIFQGNDQGIVAGVLIGEESFIPEEVENLYFKLGIGHILALSGLHIGIITVIIMSLCKWSGFSYYARYGVTICSIWGYTLFTGAATSTVRAAIMITVLMVGRCLWEEEDIPTSIALSAAIILVTNPFQLYQVGFQLSFTAIIAIAISHYVIQQIEEIYHLSKKVKRAINSIVPPSVIFLFITPILAYHFFEVPFLGSLFNLLVLPIFSLLIPYMLACLIVSLFSLNIAIVLGRLVIGILAIIERIGQEISLLPFVTLCVGRPSLGNIILYYLVLGWLVLGITRKIDIKQVVFIGASVMGIFIMDQRMDDKVIEVTQLYVGQGDSSVIITPENNAVILDGGPTGKGKTIERYLKYKGISDIKAAIISHPHEDHVGGILELIEKGVAIEHLFIPQGLQREEELEKLYEICERFNIPIYEIGTYGRIKVDGILFECLWPDGENTSLDTNENSAVILMRYGMFEALYTGDIGKQTDNLIKDRLEDIDVLKVAHHGSKNSTQESLLLQTQPEYAIISCGINNLYKHPHEETLELLEKYPINILRTDKQGAITCYTDGNDIKIDYQIKE